MTKRALGVTRIDIRGDKALGARYIPRARVLLQRAIEAVAADAKKAYTERERQGDGTIIIAHTGFEGRSILIDTSAASGCCTYTPELPPDPLQDPTDPSSDSDDMFGDPAWGDYRCGDEMDDGNSWNTSVDVPPYHLEEEHHEDKCYNPCPEKEGMAWYWTGVVRNTERRVCRVYDQYRTNKNAGNSRRIFMTTCDNKPVVLSWSIDVQESQDVFDWTQKLAMFDGVSWGTTTVLGGPDYSCINAHPTNGSYKNYFEWRWWYIDRHKFSRRGQFIVDAVIGGVSVNLINIVVTRDYFYEHVSMHTALTPDDRLGIGHCADANLPTCFNFPNPTTKGAWAAEYNHVRDDVDYNPINISVMTGCPPKDGEEEKEEEGPTPDDGTYQEVSPNGNCVRCKVYEDGEIVCVGEWLDRATGGPCEDPGEAPPEPPPDSTDGVEDQTPEPVEPTEREDEFPSPVDEPWDDVKEPVFPDIPPEYPFPEYSDGSWTDYTQQYSRDENPRPIPDVDERTVSGPPRGKMAGIVHALLYSNVEIFENYYPPNLIELVTGGKKCPEPPTP
jgi:hypothetical protein